MSDARAFSQPDGSDVHVDAPLGAPKPKGRFAKRLTFLARFRDLLVQSGKLTADDYDTLVKQARGHAGGIAKADARLAASGSPAHRERRFADAMAARTGVMVGLWLDPLAAQALAIPGGEAADDLHVTLAMLGNVDDYDDLALARLTIALDQFAAYSGALSGDIGGYGRFYGDDADESADDSDEGDATDPDVFVALPDVPGIEDLQDELCDVIGQTGVDVSDDHGFTPHISLAYLAKGAPDPATKPTPIPLDFRALTLCVGDRRTTIPLRGMAQTVVPMAAYGDVVVGETDRGPALFADVALAEVPKIIPILPKPGTYAHPVYGEFAVTPDLIDTIIAHFDSRVRPQDVPINAEHVSKTAGALGYVRKVVRRDDGGLDGIPEFTDLGAEMIRRDRFKYCSAEIDVYEDPLTTDETPNVLFGVALTTRPFFKETYLPRMAASDDGRVVVMSARSTPPGDRPEDHGMSDKDTDQKFSDLEARLAAKDAEAKAFADQLAAKDAESKAFAEQLQAKEARIATIEDERRADRLMAEIRGKSDANGTPYLGDRAKVFAHMTSLAKQFGEDSEEFRFYRDEKRAEATRAVKSGLFAEIGSDGRGELPGAYAQLETGAKARQQAHPELTFAEAFTAECKAQPALFAEYQKERS